MEYEVYTNEDGLYYVVGECGQTDCFVNKNDAIAAYCDIVNNEYYDTEEDLFDDIDMQESYGYDILGD